MSGESKVTTDHAIIKEWSEVRKGKPSVVKGTEKNEKGVGLLRINFPGYEEDNLEDISWKEFFNTFDSKNLAMVYQENTKDGELSRFHKFIDKNEGK